MHRIRERQEHILIGCSDARDVGQIHIDAVRNVREAYFAKGIDARFHALRVPGATVTDDIVTEIVQIVSDSVRDDLDPSVRRSFFVHIQAHGVISGESDVETPRAYELDIEDDAAHNCGMMGATQVGRELEALLLTRRPFLRTQSGEGIRIETEADIRTLLRTVYGFDGYLAGDWIRSIDNLSTHARAQRSRLERRLRSRGELRRIDVQVTAGLQDYLRHRHYRTDRDEVMAPFWDDLHREIHRLADELPEDADRQTGKQRPIAGLFGMARIEDSPRGLAAPYYIEKRGLKDRSHAGALFTLSGSSYDSPHMPFGPYALAGIYYALAHLKVAEFIVMGRNQAQTSRMVAKIQNDPIAAFLFRELGGSLLAVTTEEIIASRESSPASV